MILPLIHPDVLFEQFSPPENDDLTILMFYFQWSKWWDYFQRSIYSIVKEWWKGCLRVGQEKLKYIENGTNEILNNHQDNAELKIAGQKIGITSKQLEIKINNYDGIQSSKEWRISLSKILSLNMLTVAPLLLIRRSKLDQLLKYFTW